MAGAAVWEELARRGATIAVVPFWGRAGCGGEAGTVVLSRVESDGFVDVERWISRDKLTWALEGPIWDRYGSFTGQPLIRGTVTWQLAHRFVVIAGERDGEPSEEVVS